MSFSPVFTTVPAAERVLYLGINGLGCHIMVDRLKLWVYAPVPHSIRLASHNCCDELRRNSKRYSPKTIGRYRGKNTRIPRTVNVNRRERGTDILGAVDVNRGYWYRPDRRH